MKRNYVAAVRYESGERAAFNIESECIGCALAELHKTVLLANKGRAVSMGITESEEICAPAT